MSFPTKFRPSSYWLFTTTACLLFAAAEVGNAQPNRLNLPPADGRAGAATPFTTVAFPSARGTTDVEQDGTGIQGTAATSTRRQNELARWERPFRSISLQPGTGAAGGPTDYSQDLFSTTMDPTVGRSLNGPITTRHWQAAELWHQPLYFDDPLLERYGQTPLPRMHAAISAAHFFGTLPVLPYKMAMDHPRDCVSTLGYYRPGSPAPCLNEQLPWDWRAFTWESGTWLGIVFLIP
jgi:hypothetical protein